MGCSSVPIPQCQSAVQQAAPAAARLVAVEGQGAVLSRLAQAALLLEPMA